MENNLSKKLLPNILITGTPGVGKTSFDTLLTDKLLENKNLNFKNINIGKLVNDKKLYKNWNKEYDVPEFDEDMICDELEPIMLEGGVILDFHSAGFLPEEWINLVVLLRCNNTQLYDRLKARGYNDKKITENIDCEIMEVTSEEVRDSYKSDIILELKNEVIEDMEKNLDIVFDYLTKNQLI